MENTRNMPEERLLLKNLHKIQTKTGISNAALKGTYTRLRTKYTRINNKKIRSAINRALVFNKREGGQLVFPRPLSKRKTRKNRKV